MDRSQQNYQNRDPSVSTSLHHRHKPNPAFLNNQSDADSASKAAECTDNAGFHTHQHSCDSSFRHPNPHIHSE